MAGIVALAGAADRRQNAPMSIEPLERALRASIADGHVSRTERKALRTLIQDADLSEHEATLLRGRAFAIARELLDESGPAETIAWLEDVVGLIAHHAAAARPPADEAAAFFSPGEDCLGAIVTAFRRVRREADVCVFTITDNRIADGILAAARRGVTVRIISDDDKESDTGSDLAALRRAGIPVRTDSSPDHMHHKFAIFDRTRLLTGSFNWTRSASHRNHENLLITSDKRLVAAYGEEFERLWNDLA
jgi:cardiolipin hydrolase